MSQAEQPSVLIVDDDLFMLDFLHDALSESCQLITAESGQEALDKARQQHPQLIIADVQMPGMDGYTLCRELKDDFDTCDIPVIFLSALDSIDDRLQGFEIGGEDYLLKPINPKVLEAKVIQTLRRVQERQQLKSQSQYATNTAMVAMTSMSETGMVIEAIKRFNLCQTPLALASELVNAQAMFEVNSVVQLLLPNGDSLIVNQHGPASELESSILQHMAGMDRITQYRNRLAITYPHTRTLITNIPQDDPERCGRLRDHLAMLVEAAEVRLDSLNTSAESESRGSVIEQTIQQLTETLANIDELQRTGRASASLILNNIIMRVEVALVGLQLTDSQENALMSIIHDGMEDVSSTLLVEAHFQDQLSAAIRDLQKAVGTYPTTALHKQQQ